MSFDTQLQAIESLLASMPPWADEIIWVHRDFIHSWEIPHINGDDCWCEPQPFTVCELRRIRSAKKLEALLLELEKPH